MAVTPSSPRYCHGCGGPNPNLAASVCGYCAGPLVPMGAPHPGHAVRCHGCTKLVALGASFCPGCGVGLAKVESGGTLHDCPGCLTQGHAGTKMVWWGLSPTPSRPAGHAVHGCRRCGGVWVQREVLDAVIRGATTDGGSAPRPGGPRRKSMPPGATTNIIYRPCPTCNALMMRRNFGRVSGIIVDECRRHGSYFDIGELEDVLAFVRSGGLQAAQRHADEEHSRVMRQRVKVAALETSGYAGLGELPADDLGNAFSRLIARWLSRRF